jgi:hypothetical protein
MTPFPRRHQLTTNAGYLARAAIGHTPPSSRLDAQIPGDAHGDSGAQPRPGAEPIGHAPPRDSMGQEPFAPPLSHQEHPS